MPNSAPNSKIITELPCRACKGKKYTDNPYSLVPCPRCKGKGYVDAETSAA